MDSERLDQLDWRLLEALQENARLTYAELGRRVSLSPPAVAERVRQLEESGVITGYRAQLDLPRLGLEMLAIVRVVVATGPESEGLGRRMKEVPEVLECHRVTGSDSHVMKIAVRSVRHLEELLDRIMPRTGDTITSIVLSTPVQNRVITREQVLGT